MTRRWERSPDAAALDSCGGFGFMHRDGFIRKLMVNCIQPHSLHLDEADEV